jgi:hypothetical protein
MKVIKIIKNGQYADKSGQWFFCSFEQKGLTNGGLISTTLDRKIEVGETIPVSFIRFVTK